MPLLHPNPKSPAQRAALRPARDDAAPPPEFPPTDDRAPNLGRPRMVADPDHRHIPGDPEAQAKAVWLTLIVGVAVALRAIVFVLGPMTDPSRAHWPDPAAGPIYTMALGLAQQLGVPSIWWLGLQCVVSALTPLVVFALTLTLLQRTGPALVAAAIVTAHPAAVVSANALTHETWCAALLAVGLYTALGIRPMRADAAGLGGVAIGLAWLARPMTLVLAPLVALWMLLHRRKVHTVAAVAVFLAGSAVAPLGWYAWTKYDRTAAPAALVTPAHRGFSRDSVLASELMLRPSVDRLYHEFGIAHASTAPAEAFADGTATLLGPPDPATDWIAGVWVGLNAVMLVLSLAALPVLAWRRRYLLMLLLGGLMAALVLTALPETGEGLRLPVILVQAVLIASLAVPGDLRPKPAKRARRDRRRDPFNLAAVDADHAEPASAVSVGRPI